MRSADVLSSPRGLCSELWDELVARFWGQRPAVIKRPFDAPLPTEQRALGALRTASDEFRAHSDFPHLRVSVDGGFRLVDLDERLPGATDSSLEDYGSRISPWLGSRSFLVTLNDYQVYDHDFYRRIRPFLRELYTRVGHPSGHFLANLWLGIYRATPIGIHTDHADTFSYLIAGEKRMLVWPHDVFSDQRAYITPGGEHLGTTRVDRFRDRAIVLEAEPGDLMYWPASYWHIAESDGAPSLSCNWAYQSGAQQPLELVSGALQRLIHQRLEQRAVDSASPGDEPSSDVDDGGLPAAICDARRMATEVAASSELDEAVVAAWLRPRSSHGFEHGPRPAGPLALDPQDRLRRDPEEPILHASVEHRGLVVAAAGRTFTLAEDPRSAELLARLSSAQTSSVESLEAPFDDRLDGGLSRAHVRLWLEELVRLHVLERVAP